MNAPKVGRLLPVLLLAATVVAMGALLKRRNRAEAHDGMEARWAR